MKDQNRNIRSDFNLSVLINKCEIVGSRGLMNRALDLKPRLWVRIPALAGSVHD